MLGLIVTILAVTSGPVVLSPPAGKVGSHLAAGPVVLPPPAGKVGMATLVVLVPGGKVPPETYAPVFKAIQARADAGVWVAIVRCGQLNLCDPLGQLPSEVAQAIGAANTARGAVDKSAGPFEQHDTFIFGHSLGGTGARHYVDSHNASGWAGLALLGTQYNGDNERFEGTLGYPLDLREFPIPMLALLGELDMVPTSHAALLFEQYKQLAPVDQAAKPVVIIPGMDHSQFCPGFNVSGDITPELSNDQATALVASVMAAWIDGLRPGVPADRKAAAATTLATFVANGTAGIATPWLLASAMENTQWCERAQLRVAGLSPEDLPRLTARVVLVNSSLNLEHGHPNYTITHQANGSTALSVVAVSYPFYANQSHSTERYLPTYSSASDISCKMVSPDRIWQQLNITGRVFPDGGNTSCATFNRDALAIAKQLIGEHWPAAIKRFGDRGGTFEALPDSSTFAGPQWVFTTSLSFAVSGDHSTVKVQSPTLFSSVTSSIYPGNLYCKLLSPAKAVEWVMTTGLKGRY